MAARNEEKRVRRPHPLMQQGTPAHEIESDHILRFTIFRMGGGGAPVHVETIASPMQYTDPEDIHRLVGGGNYIVKALANEQTSGRPNGSLIATTNYTWDGAPIVRAAPVPPAPGAAPPPPSLIDQAASHGPAIVGAMSTAFGTILQIVNSGRENREREERLRREYDDNRRREEREDRERRDAKERAEADERRAEREAREAERRARDEERERERRAAEQRREDERLAMMRAESERRAQTEQLMLKTLLESRNSGGLDQNILLKYALERPAQQQSGPSIDSILGAAQKMKEFSDNGDKELLGAAIAALAPTPVGQEVFARAASLFNLYPKPEKPSGSVPPVLVPESAVDTPQIPEQVPVPPTHSDGVAPGPVTIN